MTIIRKHKEYSFGEKTFYVEEYLEKFSQVWLWRYGQKLNDGKATILSEGLFSRPNLKQLFG